MKLAKSNTNKNLETCGVLAGSLVSVDNIFWIRTRENLIVYVCVDLIRCMVF